MAHQIVGASDFDGMAAKMLGHVVIPTVDYDSDDTFESVQQLAQALIDLGATARTLTAGGTVNVNLYQSNGPNVISTLQSDVTDIQVNGEVGGFVDTLDENSVPIRLEWRAYYLDQSGVG